MPNAGNSWVLIGAMSALLVSTSMSRASFVDNEADLLSALTELRGAIGDHARVLKVDIDARTVAIEAQDPANRQHVDRWEYKTIKFGPLQTGRLAGPQPVQLQMLNPVLEENLFDLDVINFSATSRLQASAIKRVGIQDPPTVTRMEIARRLYILPKPSSGDVRWTLSIGSARESARVFANASGAITGMDVGETMRAKTLNLLKEPDLIADAAAAFRETVGAEPVLTRVGVDHNSVGFATSLKDEGYNKLMGGLPATMSFTWNLSGLVQRLGSVDINAATGRQGPAPFGVGDVDWTILGRIEADALAKVAIPGAAVTEMAVAKSPDRPGDPQLVWSVDIRDPRGEKTTVVTDTKGAIQRVVLPASRQTKINWMEPGALARAISRIGSTFGPNVRIASISADDRGGKITIDDPTRGGEPATFDLVGDDLKRASISFSFSSSGARFGIADVSTLTEEKLASIEADAMKRLGAKKQLYLESVQIGAHMFVKKAGARAIEIRFRDIPVDSARANYAWIVYGFDGKVLDYVMP
jgi:hypothetical protein